VFEAEPRLRHLEFFEEIASLDEGTPAWNAATAGLVVLRLVDAWLEDGPNGTGDDDWTVRSVRAAIEEVEEAYTGRALLSRVVDALEHRRPDIHVVVTPLMAYAQALEYDAKWKLAADVYHTVLAHVHPVSDSDASIGAHLRLGQCYRNLNRTDEATASFAAASSIATTAGDMVGVLRARIGEAQLAMVRGNLPTAETILDDAITLASGAEMRDVRSRALHVRANVAYFRKQYELAIRLAYDALSFAEAPTERDRILGDIAVSFLELGIYSAATNAYLVLSATAQEQYVRWAAALNLMDVASATDSRMLFELYRRELAREVLPPRMATAFEVFAGVGYQRFGELPKARLHLERAVTMASEHGFNQYLFEAEEALFELETRAPPRHVEGEVPLDVREVANAIRNLREAAGVA
jgi:tetratricopeptide (TPR) repeat protein